MRIAFQDFIPKQWKGVLVVLAAGPLLFFGPFIAYDLSSRYSIFIQKREGDRARDKIEAYRTAHGVLPPNLEAVGIQEDPIYYWREEEKAYILWFGTTLGESVTYSSMTGRWDN